MMQSLKHDLRGNECLTTDISWQRNIDLEMPICEPSVKKSSKLLNENDDTIWPTILLNPKHDIPDNMLILKKSTKTVQHYFFLF